MGGRPCSKLTKLDSGNQKVSRDDGTEDRVKGILCLGPIGLTELIQLRSYLKNVVCIKWIKIKTVLPLKHSIDTHMCYVEDNDSRG